MRPLFFLVTLLGSLVLFTSSWASSFYYNEDIGYTIWLPPSWAEASSKYLDWAKHTCTMPVQGDDTSWEAGYVSAAEDQRCSLLVEVKDGRKMQAADISNFNSFLVRSLHRMVAKHDPADSTRTTLKSARYFEEKKTLRLETEVIRNGELLRCLTYVVYTRKGMLTFVGYVKPADEHARQAIDEAVLTLYLDDRIRY
ncbi:hypothetical protein [Pseudodesulfovibrio sediminis]|uniref:Uncharacterized protein n=1 Tax=Pseudodesulfovibrio sediminis TaxID=2810563 RepID=A0ABM7P677_9BACT|nr:hypothetical protein [Pseudodesulfovibrio sediminis]BCS88419.1 hypothetical protein PSDVSF_16610 [Pseudodesulfovibrio sediminis]